MKSHKQFIILLSVLLLWVLLLVFFTPQELVSGIGEEQSYILIFLLAVLTGGSSFTAAVLYSTLITFVHGGLPLFPVAVAAGLGGVIGDTLYYYLGRTSNSIMGKKSMAFFTRVQEFLEKKPRLTPIAIFLYAAFVPLPDDLLTIGLGLSNYPYKKMILPLLLGNIVFYVLWLSVVTSAISFFVIPK